MQRVRRARQAARVAACRVANRVARARDEEPSALVINARKHCHGRAARTRREELIVACCSDANSEMGERRGEHKAQGERAPAMFSRQRRNGHADVATAPLHASSARIAAHGRA